MIPRMVGAPRRTTSISLWLGSIAAALAVGLLIGRSPMLGLGLIVGAIYASVALPNLRVSLLLWMPSFFVTFLAGGGLWLKVGLAVALAALASASLTDRRILRELVAAHGRLIVLLTGFLTWLALSILWSEQASAAFSEWLKVLLSVGVLVLVVAAVTEPRHARWVVITFAAMGIFSAAIGLAGVTSGPANPDAAAELAQTGRITAGLGDPNILAATLLVAAILCLVLAATSRGLPRPLWSAGAVLSITGLAATQSRGGLIAVAVALVTALFVFRRHVIPVLALGAVLLGVGVVYFLAVPGAGERVTSDRDAGSGRTELWIVGWRAFADHPVRGVGLNQFRAESKRYVLEPGSLNYVGLISERPVVVHNTYLQSMAETGLVGLALFLAVVGSCLAAMLTAARRFDALDAPKDALLARGVFLSAVGILAAGVFFSAGVDYKTWLLLGLGPALLHSTRTSRISLRSSVPGFTPAEAGALRP